MYVSIKDFKLKLKEDGAVDHTVLLLIDIVMKWLKEVPFRTDPFLDASDSPRLRVLF